MMSKIKVVNIISDTNIGGAGKCVLTFAKNYNREHYDLTVVVPRGSLLKEPCQQAGVRVIEAEGIADESMSLKGVTAQKKLIQSLKPDIVHTHASLTSRIAARLAGVKGIVYTRHCVYEPSKLMKSLPGRLLNRLVAALFTTKAIAVAEAAAKNLTDVGIPKKDIEVVLNGIEPLKPLTEEEKRIQRQRFHVEEGEWVISLIARLEEVKGHKYFIEAARLLKDKGYPVHFIAAGTGSIEQKLRDSVKNGEVDFCGFINDPQNLVGITDISVNASYGTEATSISLLEGMSLGIPAVVSDYGGNPGVIQDGKNGLLFPTHDAAALAAAIEKLLLDPQLYEKLKQGAKEIFAQTFTAQVMTRNIEKVYDTVIKNRRKNNGE